MTVNLHLGDCLDVLKGLEANSFDGVLTDPPYGLSGTPDAAEVLRHWLDGDDYKARGGGFMGRAWDSFVPGPATWKEVYRVLKPGGHLLAFGGTRTFDLLTMALRLAGFQVRDVACYLYGSGFPKSANIGKMIDKAAGAEREAVAPNPNARPNSGRTGGIMGDAVGRVFNMELTAPATPLAQTFDGYGTALKPAWEPCIVAMKPTDGTFANNAAKWGVSGLAIDACRIGHSEPAKYTERTAGKFAGIAYAKDAYSVNMNGGNLASPSPSGRWPANLILSPEAAALLDQQSGERPAGYRVNPSTNKTTWFGAQDGTHVEGERGYSDTGGASRYFKVVKGDAEPMRFLYTAKASRREREAGLEIDGAWLDSIELIWHNGSTSRLAEVLLWENQGQSQSTDLSGEALPVRGIYGDTIAPQDGNDSRTSSNGNGATGLYLTAIRFTTSTETSATIESKTLSLLAALSTSGSTEDATRTLRVYGLSPAESVALTSLLKRITTNGAAVYPRGASNAPKRTPQQTSARDALSDSRGNFHSTVKPLALTEYLARLILPPAAYRETARLLVPFAGSGSEMIGALRAGWQNVDGIELESEYVEIARRRLDWWQRQLRDNSRPLPDWVEADELEPAP